MSYFEKHIPQFVSVATFQKGLGTAAQRKACLQACSEFYAFDQLKPLVHYPRRHDELQAGLKKLDAMPDSERADRLFGRLIESERAPWADEMGRLQEERLRKATIPLLLDLYRKLIDLLETAYAKECAIEKAKYAQWGLNFESSNLLLSIRGTIDKLTDDLAEGRIIFFNGEPPERLLGAWFEQGAPLIVPPFEI